MIRLIVLSLAFSSFWSPAHAQSTDETTEQPVGARSAANEDAFTPGLFRSTGSGRAFTTGVVSWSDAADKTTVDLHGEVSVWGPVRLVLRVDNVFDTARPGIGAAVQWLDERKHGVSSSAYFQYKAEGFTEPEGELELLLSFGKQISSFHGTANVAYGQDPEARERDGEIALGLHVEPMHGLFTGAVGRFRDALGSNGDKATGVLRDVLGAASATYVVDKFAVTGVAGIAGVEVLNGGGMKTGPTVALSIGAMF